MLVGMRALCSAAVLVYASAQYEEKQHHGDWMQKPPVWKRQGGMNTAHGGKSPAQQPSIMERLKRKCEWLKILRQNPSRGQEFLKKYPKRYAQLEKECGLLLEKQANVDKESLETQCAWIATLKEMGQEETLRHHKWYTPLAQKCEGVPRAEWQDNADDVLKKKCVWVNLLEMAGKATPEVENAPWYKGLKQKCHTEPDGATSRMKAMQMATQLQDAATKVQSVFGAFGGGQGTHGHGDDDYEAEEGGAGRPIQV